MFKASTSFSIATYSNFIFIKAFSFVPLFIIIAKNVNFISFAYDFDSFILPSIIRNVIITTFTLDSLVPTKTINMGMAILATSFEAVVIVFIFALVIWV